MIRSTLIPIMAATSLSSLTARMARPVQVFCTNTCSPSIKHNATPKIVSLMLVTITPPSSKRTSLRIAG